MQITKRTHGDEKGTARSSALHISAKPSSLKAIEVWVSNDHLY